MTQTRIIVAASLLGLAVLSAFLGALILSTGRAASIEGFQRTADPAKIVLVVTIGLLDDLAERTVSEDANSVTVTVRVRTRSGSSVALGVNVPVTVSLREPLGSRRVLDSVGRTVPDLGAYEVPRRTTP